MRNNLSRRTLGRLALALGLGLMAGPGVASAQIKVMIHGTDTALGETPIVVPLVKPLPPGPYQLNAPEGGGSPIPAQVFKLSDASFLGFVLDRLDANAEVTRDLVAAPAGDDTSGVTLTTEGKRVKVAVAGEPLTEYIPDDGSKPYLFPLHGPGGVAMTRSYPMRKVEGETSDHPHHCSVWYAHGNVNGVDFWSLAPNHGTIAETSRSELVQGPALGVLRTTDDWLDENGKVVVQDERVVRFYATKEARIFDFDITLLSPGQATFADTKEGTFALRVATSMDVTAKKGGKIVTSEKLADKAAWGQAAAWVDYAGPVGSDTFGITILNHPNSFRYPTTWHVRDYGLFAANPFGWHDFGRKETGAVTLKPGETLRFGYRVILHRGDAASSHPDQAFDAYAHPPRVEVMAQ